jgi:prepilin-type N-terminal cleavage/methylation domain-containing protein
MTRRRIQETFAIHPSASCGFTLLEVLICLAVVGILTAAAAPLLSDMFARTQADEASSALEESVADLHEQAVTKGASRRAVISPSGLEPGKPLPPGWTLEVRRMADSGYRKPREGEIWIFNDAGICEPLAFRLVRARESVELRFDPLTGESLHD